MMRNREQFGVVNARGVGWIGLRRKAVWELKLGRLCAETERLDGSLVSGQGRTDTERHGGLRGHLARARQRLSHRAGACGGASLELIRWYRTTDKEL